jgi:hypothetical protein
MLPDKPTETSNACPLTQELRQWLDGELELSEATREHLDGCHHCATRLAELSDDEGLKFVADQARLHSGPRYTAEPEFQQLRSRLNAWSLDSPGTKTDSGKTRAHDLPVHDSGIRPAPGLHGSRR